MWGSDSHPSTSTIKVYLFKCRLTLSGVGPETHLSEVGKTCIHDLPGVGSTLVFQLNLSLILSARSHLRSNNILRPVPRFRTSICIKSAPSHHPSHPVPSIRHWSIPQYRFRILLFLPFGETTTKPRSKFSRST